MISIVLTSHNRPMQLLETLRSIDKQAVNGREIIVVNDGTDDRTQGICWAFDTRHIRVKQPPSPLYRNPSRSLNVGIRAATGDIVILQNAECKHVGKQVITDLVDRVTDTNCVFTHVMSINQDGSMGICYCGPENPRPYFFCGAIRREWFIKLRGFDEDYTGYGWEDNDMADRLSRSGVSFEFTDIEVHHQWHPPAGEQHGMEEGRIMFETKRQTDVVRNLGREWGQV